MNTHDYHGHGHDHGHTHDHGHAHDHSTMQGRRGRAFLFGIGLNMAFVLVEGIAGLVAHSMALLAEAGHNLGDVLGLGLAWGATVLAGVKPSTRRTFGYRRTTIVASVANSLILLFVTGGLTWESIRRLLEPRPAAGATMIAVALIGTVINAASALLFLRDRKRDLNLSGAFLHLASDAVLSAGVAITGAVILATRWYWLDPLVSIALALAILAGTWSLMARSMNLMLDAVPEGIDPSAVKAFLGALPGVIEVHDLHIWAMSTTETALTAHVVMPAAAASGPTFLSDVSRKLNDVFGIEHATLQIDPAPAAGCVSCT